MSISDDSQWTEILARAENLGPRERLPYLRARLGEGTPQLRRALEELGLVAEEVSAYTRRRAPDGADGPTVPSPTVERRAAVNSHDETDVPEAARAAASEGSEATQRSGSSNSSSASSESDEHLYEEPQTVDRSGTVIDTWKLIRRLGGGGMGEVYLAERSDDYNQRVAIKLVRPDLLSPVIRTRLRAERQIMARLQHTNIARLLDGGATADGIPYLVMEYIDGLPIDQYCDKHRLGIDARLALIRQVCAAVHAAHQNLVVHRDLKPSNILVTHDGIPKLLDFGIAKLLDVQQTSHTLAMTQADVRLMTPDHASPEQVRGEVITTASDVYVLGVLMYELLGGRRPFKIKALRVADIERAICVDTPLPPSVALDPRKAANSHPSAETIAEARSTTVRRLRRDLAEDLDNIVLMAMRKEPERRYSSADQLSADIGRHLEGQPVIARPDSWSYRSSKFVRRHAMATGLSGAIAVLLVVFAVGMYLQNMRIERERAVSEQERERHQEVARFLAGLFKLSDPNEARGREITATEILSRGAERVEREMRAQPQTQATMMETIGRVYLQMGRQELARPQIEGSLERRRKLYQGDHDDVASSLVAAGELERDAGQLQIAEQFERNALAMYERLHGRNHMAVADTLLRLGQVLKQGDRTREAAQAFEESLFIYTTLGVAESTSASSVLNELAQVEGIQGRHAQAEQLIRRALAIEEKVLGADAPQAIFSRHNLADTLKEQGRMQEARPLYEQSIAQLRKVMGEKHGATIDALGNYGRFLQDSGDLDGAERYFRESLALNREVRGNQHFYVGYDLVSLGNLLRQRGKLSEAEAALDEALRNYGASLGKDHLYVASAQAGRARILLAENRPEDALLAADHALAIREKQLDPGHLQIAEARALRGRSLMLLKRSEAARDSLERSVREMEATVPQTDRRSQEARLWLAQLQAQTKDSLAPARP